MVSDHVHLRPFLRNNTNRHSVCLARPNLHDFHHANSDAEVVSGVLTNCFPRRHHKQSDFESTTLFKVFCEPDAFGETSSVWGADESLTNQNSTRNIRLSRRVIRRVARHLRLPQIFI